MNKNLRTIAGAYTFCFLAYQLFPKWLKDVHLEPYDVHIHHFTYGIILLAILCPLALNFSSPRFRYWMSLFYGLGLFLVADELIFWITLNADYDTGMARQSGNILVFSIFLVIFLIRKIKKSP